MFDLQPLNTLALRSYAKSLVRITALHQVPELCAETRSFAGLVVLGGGSNVVLPERLDATVAQVALRGIRLCDTTPEAWIVEAAAGENWHDFVTHCVRQGWHGLENLALIPGTVGAAPVQNIGAYGIELCRYLQGVTAFDFQSQRWCELDREACAFAYRDSLFKRSEPGRWLITHVRLALPRAWEPNLDYPDLRDWPAWKESDPTPAAVFDAVCEIRRSKLPDPAVLPNAGSFFKNPIVPEAMHAALAIEYPALPAWRQPAGGVKLAAGWLIDQCGWKGRRLGPVGMHERHALVLVNHGGAVANDVITLTRAIQNDVFQRFGVRLEPEPVTPGAIHLP